jgi:hypothetical protein
MDLWRIMRIHSLLKGSEDFIQYLDQCIYGIELNADDRSRLAVGCFEVALEHQKAIVLLVSQSFYGSAFALVRLIFEAHIRGPWLLHCASERDLWRFTKGKLDKSFDSLIKEIEKLERYNFGVLSRVKTKSWSAMNSYTHSGYLQVLRRNSAETIEPNYGEDEIVEVLNFANAVGLLSAVEITLLSGSAELANSIVDKVKTFSQTDP